MTECPNTLNVIVFGMNKEKRTAMIFNPKCNSWNCEACFEEKKVHWIHQAARGSAILQEQKADLQFITLTSRGYTTPVSSVKFFRDNWPKLRKRAADLTNGWEPWSGYRWAYFLVPERHKSGVLHAHLIAATHIAGKRWWKDNAYASGFGYQVDVIEMVDPKACANYVAKYLHKDAGGLPWPKGFMRVRHSQNWPISREKKDETWEWAVYKNKNTVWQEKHALIDMGWAVIDKTE